MRENKMVVPFQNQYSLVAIQNEDPEYTNEIFIGVMNADGSWHQDLAIVRNAYEYDGEGNVVWKPGKFEVLVYGDADLCDYTNRFSIDMWKEKEGG